MAPVRPLHLLRYGNLPAKTKKKFDNAWRPVLELMHHEVASTIASNSIKKVNDQFIRSTYEFVLRNVCLRYPDIAISLQGNRVVSTCSKAVKASVTKKRKAAHISN